MLVILIDAGSDDGRTCEVEWRSFDTSQFASWNRESIDRSESIRSDHHLLLQNVSVALTREVEVSVIGQVEHGGFVGGRAVIDLEFVLVGQRVHDFDRQVAGKVFFSIFAQVGELERLTCAAGNIFGSPHPLVETTMQMIVTVILGQRVSDAVKGEGGVRDSVRITSDGRADVGFAGRVAVERCRSRVRRRRVCRFCREPSVRRRWLRSW